MSDESPVTWRELAPYIGVVGLALVSGILFLATLFFTWDDRLDDQHARQDRTEERDVAVCEIVRDDLYSPRARALDCSRIERADKERVQ